MKTILLKNCPFCGSPAKAIKDTYISYRITCTHPFCPISPHTPWCDTLEKAAEMWNTRKGGKNADRRS